jgi:hypothetical protein
MHNIILDTYALMDNHYHFLLKTKEENLSSDKIEKLIKK